MLLQFIQKRLANLYFIIPLCALIFWVTSDTQANSKTSLASFSEEAIFQGIFFGEGEFAAGIAELQKFNIRNFSSDNKEIQKARSFQNQVLERVRANHPEFLSQLKQAVSSRDHLAIQAAIYRGAGYVDEVIWTINPDVDENLRNDLLNEFSARVNAKTTTPDDLQVLINDYVKGTTGSNVVAKYACVLVLVVAVAVAAAVFLWVVYIVEKSVTARALANEIVVDAIANH